MAFPHPAVTPSLSAGDLGCCYSPCICFGLPCFSGASGASPIPSGSSAPLAPTTAVGTHGCTKSSTGTGGQRVWNLHCLRCSKFKWTGPWAYCCSFEIALLRAGIGAGSIQQPLTTWIILYSLPQESTRDWRGALPRSPLPYSLYGGKTAGNRGLRGGGIQFPFPINITWRSCLFHLAGKFSIGK